MNFRRGSVEQDNDAHMDITSLIDVVFLLLIFLLVSTTFRREEYAFNITLPKAGAEASEVAAKNNTIYIKKSGELYFLRQDSASDPAGDASPGPSRDALTKEGLVEHLRAAREADPEIEVHIKAEQDARYQSLIDAVEGCYRAEIRNIYFPYEFKEAVDAAAPGPP